MKRRTFNRQYIALGSGVAAVIVLFLSSCGSESATSTNADRAVEETTSLVTPTSKKTPTTTTSVAVTVTPTVAIATPTTAAAVDDRIGVLETALDAYGSGDNEALMATFAPEFRDAPSDTIEITNGQWWSWFSQYEWDAERIGCAIVDQQVVCEEHGDDLFSRILGYRAKLTFLATVENGLITDLEMQPSDGAVWASNFAWLGTTYPEETACTAESQPGSWELWVEECRDFQVGTAEEFAASDFFVVPPAIE